MASCEDVIELGSSDEETAPAPRKARPRPNAMVHIPNKLSGVTVKAPKPINPIRKLIGKGVTVTKVNSKTNANTHKFNVKKVVNPSINRNESIKKLVPFVTPIKVQNSAIGTHSMRPQNIKFPVITKKTISVVSPNKVQQMRSLNNLPPSLTITKTSNKKRPAASAIANVKRKNMKITPKRDNLLTVELDDDEPETSSSTSNPQWYLRPEEQDAKTLEEKNNAEPDTNKYIEIIIEDSPVKPVQDKRTNEIGAELAITIDDSPCKSTPAKAPVSPGSDDEKNDKRKEPHSRKKLNYPQQTTIEIELEPFDVNADQNNTSNVMEVEENIMTNDNVVEVIDSPAKKIQPATSTPKKDDKIKTKSADTNQTPSQKGEFHPVYQEFIDLCFKIENSTDMQTIVEKKIKSYYRQAPKEYTESEEFIDIVSSKILAMKAGPEKLYLYIKDIVDELNLQRKMAKAQPAVKDAREIEAEKFQYGEDSEFDSKRQRQIRKLEKTLKKLHRAIQKLEEQEVDFDDDEDSVYLLTESDNSSSSIKELDRELERERSMLLQRYKERMVRVHAKFCQLTNTKMPSEPKIHIEARPGQPAGPAKRLEKWINKKVPIGKPLPFPDFHDVLRCVKEANTEDKLEWNDVEIMEEARDLFTRCGKKLQRRRQENEWRLAASRISSELDPAETSEDLKRKLEMNKQLASKKETEVFNKYADKQNLLKLEAVEIGDKEAEESPVESEDEEPPEEETKTLETKEKRKERLKRLIEEKSKRNSVSTESPKEQLDSQSGAEETNENMDKQTEKQSETKDMEVDTATSDVNKKEKETVEIDTDSQDANTNIEDKSANDVAHSISDTSKVDSDIDELHLLQKLHSDNVNTSTIESSDSESCVDLSDSLPSSDNKVNPTSDIISIENSSYSESDQKADDDFKGPEKVVMESLEEMDTNEISEEVKCSAGIQINKTTNEEYNESVESILLASTDDEADEENKNVESGDTNSITKTNADENIKEPYTMVLENNDADQNVDEQLILPDKIANATKDQSSKKDNTKTTENKSSAACSDSEQAFETKTIDDEITTNINKNVEDSENERKAKNVDAVAEKDNVEATFNNINKDASEQVEINNVDKKVLKESANANDSRTEDKLPELNNGIKDNAKENESLTMLKELQSDLDLGTGNEPLAPEIPAETT